ncbi:hypothetical protein LDENG_00037460, partial [Lucifuga dentata]
MLSLAATVSGVLSKTLHLSDMFLAQKKTFIMAVAFCIIKEGGAAALFFLLKKQKTFWAPSSSRRAASPSRGVRQAVVAAQFYCSMLLIVLLVDSSFRCFVVYLQVTDRQL